MVSTTIPIVGEDLQLHYFSLSTDETNVDIMARMRELSTGNRSIMHRFAKNTMHALLMREPAVGKALALRVSVPKTDTARPFILTHVDSRSRS